MKNRRTSTALGRRQNKNRRTAMVSISLQNALVSFHSDSIMTLEFMFAFFFVLMLVCKVCGLFCPLELIRYEHKTFVHSEQDGDESTEGTRFEPHEPDTGRSSSLTSSLALVGPKLAVSNSFFDTYSSFIYCLLISFCFSVVL